MQQKSESFNTFPSSPQESAMNKSDPLILLHNPSLDNTLESLVPYSYSSKSNSTIPSYIESSKNHSSMIRTHNHDHDPSLDSEKIICFAPSTPHKEHIHCSSSSGRAAGCRRLRWSEDLHHLFVQSVKSLGGAKKATQKEILRLMNYDGLTIFHVKSHLQKYRTSRYISESTESSIPLTTGFNKEDALIVQIGIQKQLCEQLEDQRNLQLRLEEQRKQLQMMIDQLTKWVTENPHKYF